ncbi:ribosome small subunit-dependent GTPase A [Roseivirga sp. BDSF3-8]|uniref:ribosome small subunit-dependent GTPase A n=1 Tax=Roseivirga sp. BDSF3-8 TaxID=3241598 RepID=UPI0035327431
MADRIEGMVIKSTGSWYSVRTDEGERLNSRLRGKFKNKGLKVNNPIAVGDRVVVELEDVEEGTAVITDILPRDNYIIRKSTRRANYGHIIAANIDQAILIATIVMPRTSMGFIDRFLVTTETFRIPAILLFNKKDLLDQEAIAAQQEVMDMYEALGYPCYSLSAIEDQDVEQVKELLRNKVSLLSGHSGVGKSTLVNRISPEVDQKTDTISGFANKGKHTTTFAEMFEIMPDSFVIDTPGIKELGLMEVEPEELSHYFPEMRDLLGECKYHNCTHTHEPGCAVVEAVKAAEIPLSRYHSYLSMLQGEDSHR